RLQEAVFKAHDLSPAALSNLRLRLMLANVESLRRKEGDPWDTAIDFLMKLELAKELLAADLGLAPGDVTFVEQPGFHLDVAMAVGPGGQILLQDHAAS